MRKILISFCLFVLVPILAFAQYPEEEDVKLTKKQKKAVDLADKWIQKTDYPIVAEDGSVVFLYGHSMPYVVCTPMKTSVIDLEIGGMGPGEEIKNIHVGDKIRWSVIPGVSGSLGHERAHIVVKPKHLDKTGITTNLTIMTNKRRYQVDLVSHPTKYTPAISFHYPEHEDKLWHQYFAENRSRNNQREQVLNQSNKKSNVNAEGLNFKYTIKGKAKWKPIRVYDDGLKTIIQMSNRMNQGEAPALLIMGPDGKEQIVNYRLKDNRYIIDGVFDTAILIAGIGRHQKKIEIIRDSE